ncbi:SRPBCC domain-containing protein [Hyphobacterium sp.]|uniref:SRPBCC family protein n=1 Tax=Hyphobacterium sp. TaxID=2004662 RepID=UPI00374964E4
MPKFFSRTVIAGLSLVLAACGQSSISLSAAPPETTGEVQTLSEFPIPTQAIAIAAPVEDVWAAFTTSEGYQAWASPFAVIDLRVNGTIEASYADDATVGDPANIVISILAYLPEQFLVLKTIQAPPDFASQDVLDRLVSVVEFESLEPNLTRVTISGVGYTDEDSPMREFFLQANAWSLGQLNAHLTEAASE